MQDPGTGRMEPLTEKQRKALEAGHEMQFASGERVPKDVALFTVGEKLMVKRGHFVVEEITETGLVLRGIKHPPRATRNKKKCMRRKGR